MHQAENMDQVSNCEKNRTRSRLQSNILRDRINLLDSPTCSSPIIDTSAFYRDNAVADPANELHIPAKAPKSPDRSTQSVISHVEYHLINFHFRIKSRSFSNHVIN